MVTLVNVDVLDPQRYNMPVTHLHVLLGPAGARLLIAALPVVVEDGLSIENVTVAYLA
jgi:hypothetical protein